jgi:hypothetical protein
VLEHPEREGDPLALTVNCCAPISRGEFAVGLRCTRANRSSQHWSVEFTQGESADAVLTATVITAARRDELQPSARLRAGDAGVGVAVAAPNPSPLSWVSQYDSASSKARLVLSDTPPEPPRSPRSVLWLRDAVHARFPVADGDERRFLRPACSRSSAGYRPSARSR